MKTNKVVFLNNDFVPIEDAKVSVLDRGFLFGDGVYEVIPVFGDKPLRETEHLARLENSLGRVGLGNPYSTKEWSQLFQEILKKNPSEKLDDESNGDRALYLQVTRGHYDVRDLGIIENQQPTIFIMVMHLKAVDIDAVGKGISAVTVDDFRWHACDIKSISLVANVMLRQQASQAGVDDAVLIRDGYATEGTASNLFIVKNNVLITPPKSNLLLPGITRDLVVELAESHDIQCEVREISEAELKDADEIWLTSSTREIAPVVTFNNNPVGKGVAGDLWRKMIALYQEYKQTLRTS